jgi:FAD/FMN-containing dehydrogenase
VSERSGSSTGIDGRCVWRGDPTYEDARGSALWNQRKPPRFPDVIAHVATAADVVAAVRFARGNHMRVAIRSGGHNLSGAALRDGGILIDLSRLDGVAIDGATRTAVVGPATSSRALAMALGESGLAFPVGHCGSVPMGGYLLSGGLGWNMSQWGLGCLSVQDIDVVTAAGDRITISERQHPDLFWAARGAGSGFFGVATAFRVRAHPLPSAIRSSTYVYRLADVEEVSAWARDIAPSVPRSVEMLLQLITAPPGAPSGPAGKAIVVAATVFEEDERRAAAALGILETCPALTRAFVRNVNAPTTFAGLHVLLDQRLPAQHRYIEDALWCAADYATLLPRLAEQLVDAPSPRSLVMATMPPRGPDDTSMPSLAFSVMGTTFVLCYSIWGDAQDDGRNRAWHTRLTDSVAATTLGRYIAEADLEAEGAARASFSTPAWERLRALKAIWDPDNVFHDFVGSRADQEDKP